MILACDRKYPHVEYGSLSKNRMSMYRANVFRSVQNATYKNHALNNQQAPKEDTSRRNKVPAISSWAIIARIVIYILAFGLADCASTTAVRR